MEFRRDCKSFPGTFACETMTAEGYKDCSDCMFYEPIEKKVLVIQLGAMGDVIRSTSIVPAIKEKYGHNSKISWITAAECKFFLDNTPGVDEVIVYNPQVHFRLEQEEFDVLFNLEIAPPGTLLASVTKAKEKFGYFFDRDSHPSCFNEGARMYLEIAWSNELNRKTKKTYQELIFQACNLKYKKQAYTFTPTIDEDYKKRFRKEKGIKDKDKVLGLNLGAGGRYPSKAWSLSRVKDFVKSVSKGYKVILLGGPNEIKLKKELEDLPVTTNDFKNSLQEFISVLSLCDVIVTGDSLAMHLAISLKKPTVALFFTTPDWQIEDYSFLKKITSPMMDKYFWSDEYHEDLVESISVDEVLKAVQNG